MSLIIKGEKTVLRLTCETEPQQLLTFYSQNKTYLAPWEPLRSPEFWTIAYWQQKLADEQKRYTQGLSYHFVVSTPNQQEIIGICNFSNMVYGAFQACHLGYALSEKHQRNGYMIDSVNAGLTFMFDSIGLHRVMANYLPNNQKSAKLLEKLGFEREGYAKSYLKINGQWQDHILTAKINPKHF